MPKDNRSAARRKKDQEYLKKRKLRAIRAKRADKKRKAAIRAKYLKIRDKRNTRLGKIETDFDKNTPWHKLPYAEKVRRNALKRSGKLDEPIKAGSPGKKGFNWKKVKKRVEDAWATRLESHNIKPTRFAPVDVGFKPTGRLKKYGDGTKAGFDRNKYLEEFNEGLVKRAKQRGLTGNVKKKLERTSAVRPQETKPKYGSVIKDLRERLGGNRDPKKMIADTTEKLTQRVKSGSKGYETAGLDIIKGRSSEDGALPSIRSKQKTKKRKINDSTSTV